MILRSICIMFALSWRNIQSFPCKLSLTWDGHTNQCTKHMLHENIVQFIALDVHKLYMVKTRIYYRKNSGFF